MNYDWSLKKELSSGVLNSKLDELYKFADINVSARGAHLVTEV